MGNRKLKVKRSIKSQVIVHVIWIGVSSFLATLVTYIALSLTVPNSNTAERYAAAGERFAQRLGTAVLSPAYGPALTRLMPTADVMYQVMDASGRPIYGTEAHRIFQSHRDVLTHINAIGSQIHSLISGASAWKLIPVVDNRGALVGAVYFKWNVPFSPFQVRPTWLASTITFLILCTPFIYIAIFTYVFARRFGKKLSLPLQALVDAARKIQQRELDFQIDYQGQNEIGQLLGAFEEMRKDLKESLLRQWALEDERREMLSAISHDLRTPLTIIQGHAEMLVETKGLPTSAQRYADVILRNTDRVVRLMSDFRTVTDIDSPAFALKPVSVDFPEFIEHKFAEYEVMGAEHGIHLSLHQSDERMLQDTNGNVGLDADRVAQILDNIMANAIRFTPASGHIRWEVHVQDEGALIAICDTGKGINQSDLDKVFRKFYQGDASRSEEKGHSGLGLYIVKALVEKHGGSIRAYNNSDGGATIEFFIRFLPVQKSA